jgi:hypothetical protein
MLNIGTNFAPEHLTELFQRVRPDIERMEMCFRPYVEQATYYQFLKGELDAQGRIDLRHRVTSHEIRDLTRFRLEAGHSNLARARCNLSHKTSMSRPIASPLFSM